MNEPIINTGIEACTLIALFLPLVSFVLAIWIPKRYSWIVTFTAPLLMLFTAVCAVVVFFSMLNTQSSIAIPLEWFHINTYHFSAGIHIDHQSVIMLPVVTIVSFLVHLYSMGYMAGDKDITRYFAMLGFFTFAMLGIVMADNLLLIFMFWELVGFSSYMLIGHWTERPQAAAAAKKAFIFNRIGDAGFMIGLMIIWANAGSFDLSLILQHSEIYSWQTAASLCIFCGVIGKSAQFPLFTWLPDAMEGPTPVSALIHAATMVAAGVFLLSRLFLLFTEQTLYCIAIVGAVTSLLAALCALVQYDIKKILAYSTISQLGFMVMALGTGAKDAAMLHLFAHAFFKAGLFLGAGAIIHSLHHVEQQTHQHFDVQDIRNLGGLRKHMPVTFISFIICSAALCGLPMFSGFITKDAILTGMWSWKGDEFSWRWIIMSIAFSIPFLTVFYTFRLTWFVFFGENRTVNVIGKPFLLHEVPVVMRIPLIFLAVCSLWFTVSFNPFNFLGWLYTSVHVQTTVHSSLISIFSAVWVLSALIIAYVYFKSRPLPEINKAASPSILRQAFFVDSFYSVVIALPVRKLSELTEKIDIKWIDGFLHLGAYTHVTIAHLTAWTDRVIIDGTVNGMSYIVRLIGAFTRSFQGGKIQLYILWAVLGVSIILVWQLS